MVAACFIWRIQCDLSVYVLTLTLRVPNHSGNENMQQLEWAARLHLREARNGRLGAHFSLTVYVTRVTVKVTVPLMPNSDGPFTA